MMKITRPLSNKYRNQKGAATLLIAMVILISITIIVFLTSQTIVTEQRIAANETRAAESQEAAQAGVSYVLGLIQNGGSVSGGVASPASGASFTVGVTAETNNFFSLDSVGLSTDQSARRRVREMIIGTPAVANAPDNPLTTRGTVDLKGSGTITNPYGRLTIWSGNSMVVSGASPKTIIKHPDATVGLVESTTATTRQSDVVDNDPNLSTLTDDEYFENFFGVTPAEYESAYTTLAVNPSTTSMSDLDGVNNQIIWVDGNATMTSNIQIGTEDDPVIVIIDGDMFGAGNVTIFGMLYLTGDWDAQGNLTVNGAVVVQGDVDGTGSLDVVYNINALDNLGASGGAVAVPGTWRDW